MKSQYLLCCTKCTHTHAHTQTYTHNTPLLMCQYICVVPTAEARGIRLDKLSRWIGIWRRKQPSTMYQFHNGMYKLLHSRWLNNVHLRLSHRFWWHHAPSERSKLLMSSVRDFRPLPRYTSVRRSSAILHRVCWQLFIGPMFKGRADSLLDPWIEGLSRNVGKQLPTYAALTHPTLAKASSIYQSTGFNMPDDLSRLYWTHLRLLRKILRNTNTRMTTAEYRLKANQVPS